MCSVCGCGDATVQVHGGAGAHDHPEHEARAHPCAHEHDHGSAPGDERLVRVERDILEKNAAYAERNRARLEERGVAALNFLSSPGSGKTTLLVRTIEDLAGRFPVEVIEGDQQTSNDAERIREAGAPAVQINTGKGCHLDAHMVGHAMERLPLRRGGLLFIENVGNLVCPAAFDLGEARKVVVLSVTEGEDKPLKYPDIFAVADALLLTKVDLLPHLEFEVEKCLEYARRVRPELTVFELSAKTGKGLDAWYAWLAASFAKGA